MSVLQKVWEQKIQGCRPAGKHKTDDMGCKFAYRDISNHRKCALHEKQTTLCHIYADYLRAREDKE